MALKITDTIQVRTTGGGEKPYDIALSEIEALFTQDEQADITTLGGYVGDYSTPAGGEGSDIATDLSTVYGDVETATTGLKDRATALEAIAMSTQDETTPPLVAVRAHGTLTATGNPSADATITIGTQTYTIVAALTEPAVANEVKKGASASDTLDNLIAAINGAAGAGSTYGTGTVAHTLVTAAAGDGDTVTITAKAYGTSGNSIATTDTEPGAETNISFGAGTLAGGLNSRLCVANQIMWRAEGLIVCIEDTTAAEEDLSKYMFFAKDGA